MKANEDYSKAVNFVKKFGFEAAKQTVNSANNGIVVDGSIIGGIQQVDRGL